MTYILKIYLKKPITISVGALGLIKFNKGYYFYVGSAKRNLSSRLKRHLQKKKKLFWHIDYLSSNKNADIKTIWISTKISECKMADCLFNSGLRVINRFGSSDCKCKGHLFYARLGALNLTPLI